MPRPPRTLKVDNAVPDQLAVQVLDRLVSSALRNALAYPENPIRSSCKLKRTLYLILLNRASNNDFNR